MEEEEQEHKQEPQNNADMATEIAIPKAPAFVTITGGEAPALL
jgi:hypothetical protein